MYICIRLYTYNYNDDIRMYCHQQELKTILDFVIFFSTLQCIADVIKTRIFTFHSKFLISFT